MATDLESDRLETAAKNAMVLLKRGFRYAIVMENMAAGYSVPIEKLCERVKELREGKGW